jgi:hypothetical protein
MRYTIYEDPITHAFTLVGLPQEFVDGDKIFIPSDLRWFATHDEALAALSALLNEDE